MKLNHKYNFKSYINCLLQTENGEPLAEDEWPSEYYWREWYPKLFPDSSSELEDEQEQVGHRLKVKTAIVFPVFFKKSISVYLCDLLGKGYTKNFIDCTCKSVLLLIGHSRLSLFIGRVI